MKKFAFSLSKMLDYKDQILEKEKNHLMFLRTQKNAIDENIKALELEFEKVSLELQEKTYKGITVFQIKCYDYQLENIRYHIKQLRNEQRAMAAAIEKQLSIVIAVSQEVSGLDKLKEKQLEEYNYMLAKADELFISELVSSNLIRQKNA